MSTQTHTVDLKSYNKDLAQNIEEKLFFLPYVKAAKDYVDFGCGDGTLLYSLAQRGVRQEHLYGIDNNALQRNAAAGTLGPQSRVYASAANLPGDLSEACVVFSSVLHEATEPKGHGFETPAKRLRKAIGPVLHLTQPRYVVVRDFALGGFGVPVPGRIVSSFYSAATSRLSANGRATDQEWERVKGFASLWGEPHEDLKTLAHYCLKSPYTGHDWARERAEDYGFMTAEHILEGMREILGPEYRVVLFDHHTPDFHLERIRREFGFTLPVRTHLKLILERIEG